MSMRNISLILLFAAFFFLFQIIKFPELQINLNQLDLPINLIYNFDRPCLKCFCTLESLLHKTSSPMIVYTKNVAQFELIYKSIYSQWNDRIEIRFLNISQLFQNTPIQVLMDTEKLQKAESRPYQESDG